MKRVCIMGGGLGGLMTGALLAKEGYRVTVLEKNRIIGGGLQSFRRGKYLFDTGMHIFGGMGDDGQIRFICRHLGIEERVKTAPRRVVVTDACDSYPEAYTEKIHALTEQEPLYRLKPSEVEYRLTDLSLTAKELVEQTARSAEELRLLAYPSLLYGGREDSPAFLHALISCAHQQGTYTFTDGSVHFAELLAEVIENAGGEVRSGETVTGIETSGRQVSAVHTDKGTYTADLYVNDMPVSKLLELTPAGAFTPAFRSRIGAVPYTMSAMSVFIGLKPRSMRYDGEAWFAMQDSCELWSMDECGEEAWPQAMFALPSEDSDNPGFAATITAVCPMNYDYVKRWEQSLTGQRPKEYYRWKERMMHQAIDVICEKLGASREMMAYMDAGTPLTIRDYYGTPRGAMYGMHRSSSNPLQSSLSTRTRLTNLYLTGQDVNFHGLIGTSLTAILTAEAIVGHNTIVNKINDTIWKQ